MYIKKKKEVREMLYTVELVSLAILKTFFLLNKIQLVEALANDSLVGECGARAVAG